MDAGLPIAAPNTPNLAGIKPPGGLGAQPGKATNTPLAGFEALLSAHFPALGQSGPLANGVVTPSAGPTKLTPQELADEESSLLTSIPGKSPKDMLELVAVNPNLAQGAQVLATLLAGPQVKVEAVDVAAATPGIATPVGKVRTLPNSLDIGALSDEAMSLNANPLANANLALAGPPKPTLETTGTTTNPADPNLTLPSPKVGSPAPTKSADAPVTQTTYSPPPSAPPPVLAQQAAISPIAPKPDQSSSELRTSPNQEPGAAKVSRATTGRIQTAIAPVTTGITGKSASAIATTRGQPEPEPSPEPQQAELESVLVEAAPQSETTTGTGQPTPQAVSNAHQLTTAAVKSGPETVSNLAAQIVRNLEGRLTRFDVQLHPADLGRVDVRVEIGARGRVKASMSFENPQSAADLRGRSEELLRALESAGFDLSGGLSFDVAGDRGQGQPPPQQQATDNNNRHQGRAFDAAMALATDSAGDPRNGRLDIYQARRAAGLDIRI